MQIARETTASLKMAGVPAMVVTSLADLSRFMTDRAEQLLSAAALCACSADRVMLEGMAHQCRAWAEALSRKP